MSGDHRCPAQELGAVQTYYRCELPVGHDGAHQFDWHRHTFKGLFDDGFRRWVFRRTLPAAVNVNATGAPLPAWVRDELVRRMAESDDEFYRELSRCLLPACDPEETRS